MDVLGNAVMYLVPFLVILTALVFVHEWGHYAVARRAGVRVDVFSIGFGPELFGWNDRHGTRWRLSLIPLGGYVLLFGEPGSQAAAAEDGGAIMPESERCHAFMYKSLRARAAIVAAGPAANFAFALFVLTILFMTYGQPYTPPDVGGVLPGSVAERAGIQPGDVFVTVEEAAIERFEDVQQAVRLAPGRPLAVVLRRGEETVSLTLTPEAHLLTDRFGNTHTVGRLGISRAGQEYRRHHPLAAVGKAVEETGMVVGATLSALGDMILGARGTEELGGPLRIAQMSGEVAKIGLEATLWFVAMLSINLGLLNLFPVPMLDGGHLAFYGIEAIRGRPLGPRAQEYGFRIGLALVLTLMVFATWNDLVQLQVVQFFRDLLS